LKAPGLRKIKQVELYNKWQQYRDPQYWDKMCSEPSDDVMQQVKSNEGGDQKQIIESANSKKSEKLEEEAREKRKSKQTAKPKLLRWKGGKPEKY
jgi:hypothetical protein